MGIHILIQPRFLQRLLLWLLTCSILSVNAAELPLLNCRIEPHIEVDVSAAVDGIVSDVTVKKNDRVTAGQVLAKLESGAEKVTAELRQLQASLNSDIEAKKIAYDYNQRSLKRVRDLYKKKTVSFQQLDEAKTEAALSAQLLQLVKDKKKIAELEYLRALENLKRRTILSPIDGLVITRYKDPGEYVEDEPIIQIAQLHPLRVEIYAPVPLFGLISVGDKAEIMPELPRKKGIYQGKVVMVDQVVDAPSSTFGIRVEFPNPNYLLPSGLKCKVRFPSITLEENILTGSMPSASNTQEFSIDLEYQ